MFFSRYRWSHGWSIHMSTFRFLLMFATLAMGATALSACNTWEGMKDDTAAGVDAVSGDDNDD
jgi:predicted small secreted protein